MKLRVLARKDGQPTIIGRSKYYGGELIEVDEKTAKAAFQTGAATKVEESVSAPEPVRRRPGRPRKFVRGT